MTQSANRLRVAGILLVWTAVQWLVGNLALEVSNSAHIPVRQKIASGLRRAAFQGPHDTETAIFMTIGMLIIPVLVGTGQLGAMLAWRLIRPKVLVSGGFPRTRVLTANWIWLVYWPCWLLSVVIDQQSSFVWIGGTVKFCFLWIGGTLIIPALLALAVGFVVVRRSSLSIHGSERAQAPVAPR